MLNGRGSLEWKDGTVYEGQLLDNTITGQGTYTWPDGRHVMSWADEKYLITKN